MKIYYPLIATHRDGQTKLFYSIEEFNAWTPNDNVGQFWYELPGRFFGQNKVYKASPGSAIPGAYFHRDCRVNDWIVRDDRGNTVPFIKTKTKHTGAWLRFIEKDRKRQEKWRKYFERRDADIVNAIEKGLPIPGTSKPNRTKGRKAIRSMDCDPYHTEPSREGEKQLYEDRKIRDDEIGDL